VLEAVLAEVRAVVRVEQEVGVTELALLAEQVRGVADEAVHSHQRAQSPPVSVIQVGDFRGGELRQPAHEVGLVGDIVLVERRGARDVLALELVGVYLRIGVGLVHGPEVDEGEDGGGVVQPGAEEPEGFAGDEGVGFLAVQGLLGALVVD
jgi:hypothetical protein